MEAAGGGSGAKLQAGVGAVEVSGTDGAGGWVGGNSGGGHNPILP